VESLHLFFHPLIPHLYIACIKSSHSPISSLGSSTLPSFPLYFASISVTVLVTATLRRVDPTVLSIITKLIRVADNSASVMGTPNLFLYSIFIFSSSIFNLSSSSLVRYGKFNSMAMFQRAACICLEIFSHFGAFFLNFSSYFISSVL